MTNILLTKVVKNNDMYVVWKTTTLTKENNEIHKARCKNHEKEVVSQKGYCKRQENVSS